MKSENKTDPIKTRKEIFFFLKEKGVSQAIKILFEKAIDTEDSSEFLKYSAAIEEIRQISVLFSPIWLFSEKEILSLFQRARKTAEKELKEKKYLFLLRQFELFLESATIDQSKMTFENWLRIQTLKKLIETFDLSEISELFYLPLKEKHRYVLNLYLKRIITSTKALLFSFSDSKDFLEKLFQTIENFSKTKLSKNNTFLNEVFRFTISEIYDLEKILFLSKKISSTFLVKGSLIKDNDSLVEPYYYVQVAKEKSRLKDIEKIDFDSDDFSRSIVYSIFSSANERLTKYLFLLTRELTNEASGMNFEISRVQNRKLALLRAKIDPKNKVLEIATENISQFNLLFFALKLFLIEQFLIHGYQVNVRFDSAKAKRIINHLLRDKIAAELAKILFSILSLKEKKNLRKIDLSRISDESKKKKIINFAINFLKKDESLKKLTKLFDQDASFYLLKKIELDTKIDRKTKKFL